MIAPGRRRRPAPLGLSAHLLVARRRWLDRALRRSAWSGLVASVASWLAVGVGAPVGLLLLVPAAMLAAGFAPQRGNLAWARRYVAERRGLAYETALEAQEHEDPYGLWAATIEAGVRSVRTLPPPPLPLGFVPVLLVTALLVASAPFLHGALRTDVLSGPTSNAENDEATSPTPASAQADRAEDRVDATSTAMDAGGSDPLVGPPAAAAPDRRQEDASQGSEDAFVRGDDRAEGATTAPETPASQASTAQPSAADGSGVPEAGASAPPASLGDAQAPTPSTGRDAVEAFLRERATPTQNPPTADPSEGTANGAGAEGEPGAAGQDGDVAAGMEEAASPEASGDEGRTARPGETMPDETATAETAAGEGTDEPAFERRADDVATAAGAGQEEADGPDAPGVDGDAGEVPVEGAPSPGIPPATADAQAEGGPTEGAGPDAGMNPGARARSQGDGDLLTDEIDAPAERIETDAGAGPRTRAGTVRDLGREGARPPAASGRGPPAAQDARAAQRAVESQNLPAAYREVIRRYFQ